jgi:KaiC/GvpD/RAD55 family RecA-like ATPase
MAYRQATPSSRSTAKSPAPATRNVTVPAPEDLELAADDALLQLRIGRSAHLYAMFASAALALDGVLLLFFYPNLPTLAVGTTGAPALADSFFLLLPVLGGLAVAVVALISKWEAYQLWPWELHFTVTVAALGANAAIAVVYGLRIAGAGSFAALTLTPWFYPVELTGVSLAFVGFVLTWNSWSIRQWASALAAGLPVATALLVYFPPATTTGASSALAVSLFLSAILYLISGSFLHLISSGTRSHERALISSGQSRMFQMADELRLREEALHFREASLVKRESDVENSLMSIKRQNDSLREGRQQLDDLELDYRTRSDSLVAKERMWAGQVAELDARQRLVDDKAKGLELREQEVERLVPQVSAREQRLVEQEGGLTRRELDIGQRERDVTARGAMTGEVEARNMARTQDLDRRMAEVLRRESEVATASALAAPGAAGVAALSEREAKLQQLRATLDEQNLALGRNVRQVAEKAEAVGVSMKRVADKEAALASREAAIRQREGDLASSQETANSLRSQYTSAARDYQTRLDALRQRESEVAQKGSDLDRNLRSVGDRESTVSDREKRLVTSATALERRDQSLTARERALEAAEAEVSLRRQAAGTSPDLPIAGLAALAVADRLDAPPLPAAVRAPDSESLTPSVGRRDPERRPTGTPRLDDLLLGGIPPAGHVVVLGDAFVGKEVVLYAFLGEGLKRGEPALLLTASRSPEEVAESLGVVLPQFREYEQMGMVRWIDASGSGGLAGPSRAVAKGSDDRTGILSALVAASQELATRGGGFRVGFLGLSAVLAHGDERIGFSFLQNVVGILKPRRALTMYSLEAGALSEAQVESLLARMDGAIVFRQDRDRTFLSVKGFGEVQTRDWVECRATQRSLIIGSFALERIR